MVFLPTEIIIDIVQTVLSPNFSFRPLFPSKSKENFTSLDGFSRSSTLFRSIVMREWYRILYLRKPTDLAYLSDRLEVFQMVQALRLEFWTRDPADTALFVLFTEVRALSIDVPAIYATDDPVDLLEELSNFAAHFDIRNINMLDINLWVPVYHEDEESDDLASPVQAVAAAFPYLTQLHLGSSELQNTISLDIMFPIPEHYTASKHLALDLADVLRPLQDLQEITLGLYLAPHHALEDSRISDHDSHDLRVKHEDCPNCRELLKEETDHNEILASCHLGYVLPELQYVEWYYYFRYHKKNVIRRWTLTDELERESQLRYVLAHPDLIAIGGFHDKQKNYDHFRNVYVP